MAFSHFLISGFASHKKHGVPPRKRAGTDPLRRASGRQNPQRRKTFGFYPFDAHPRGPSLAPAGDSPCVVKAGINLRGCGPLTTLRVFGKVKAGYLSGFFAILSCSCIPLSNLSAPPPLAQASRRCGRRRRPSCPGHSRLCACASLLRRGDPCGPQAP